MECLADTHVLIWAVNNPSRLPKAIAEAITEPNNVVYFSPVSAWEIAIKFALGKLDLAGTKPEDLLELIVESGFRELTPSALDFATAHRLPRHHGDPFDRMLAWQAIRTGTTLLTADRAMEAYAIDGLRLLTN
jgi:PIN domain nuclease of toxin-antitoxin system